MLDFFVLAAGTLVPVLAWPNEFFAGCPFLGPFILLPVFWFTARHKLGASALGGALWIVLVTLLSQFWLLQFHPLAFPAVLLFQVPWYAAAFLASSFLWRCFPRRGVWAQAALWTVFEFARVQGFFSYPYGSVASSLWSWPLSFQSADLIGTSGLTYLLAWAAAWGAAFLSQEGDRRRLLVDLVLGLGLVALNFGYGVWKWTESGGAVWRPALVQQDQDPWKGGASAYESGFERLETLSRTALEGHPDAVVWSETAFVPSVEFHHRYHENPESLQLVRRLETFLSTTSVPFLVGNDHREKAEDGTIRDYNAVLAWNSGWSGRYEKNRLVPFTESFPYKKELPWVFQWLKDADTHFWEPGRGHHVLRVGSVPVGTPVCFEDAFPEGARNFNLQGALALVNLTNDAWAPGTASRLQHLSLAVFRAVETRMPLVRAGNDGATAAVSRRGELLALLPLGPPAVLQAEVKLGTGEPTLYSRLGDWFPWGLALTLVVALGWRFRPGN